MDERQDARAEIDDSRERMKDIAAELAQRAKPSHLKQQAKEAVVRTTVKMKDKAMGSPLALGIVGGLVTAGVAKMLLNKRHRYSATGQYDEDFRVEQADAPAREPKHQAARAVGAIKHTAKDLKDRAVAQFEGITEHIPSAHDVKEKAGQLLDRANHYAGEEPLVLALGAVAVGAGLGFLIPLTDRERHTLAPLREQVAGKIESMSTEVGDKVQSKVDELREKIVGEPPPPDPSDLSRFMT